MQMLPITEARILKASYKWISDHQFTDYINSSSLHLLR